MSFGFAEATERTRIKIGSLSKDAGAHART